MTENVYLTRAELARVAGVDVRNRRLAELFEPDAFLQLGTKRIALYKRGPAMLARLTLRLQPLKEVALNP